MRSLSWLFLASALALGGCAAETAPSESTAALAEEIIGGRPATSYEEAALIETARGYCSGAVIAPRVVLTAGHCLGHPPYKVSTPYADHQKARGRRSWTDYVSTGPSVNPETLDVGVIILDTPITLDTYPPLADEMVPVGTKAVNVGRIKNGSLSQSGLLYGKEVPLDDGTSLGFPLAYQSELVIQSGDSGGPVYTGSIARRRIVGVNSGGGASVQVLARVDLAYDQIRRLIAENGGDGS